MMLSLMDLLEALLLPLFNPMMTRTESMAQNMQILDWIQKPISKIALLLFTLGLCLVSIAFQWASSLPFFLQILLGMTVGFSLMGSYSMHQSRRGNSRSLCSVRLAQLSIANMVSLRKLLPDHEKALSWLPNHGDAEAARWINVGMEKLWTHFKEASLDMIRVQLYDVLNKYKSQVIQELRVTKLELGNSCPYVQGIKALHEEGNKISLEVQIDWRHNENQQMMLHVLTAGPEYVVQVKHFVIYAVIKIIFMPFKEELPCFGAVTLSIIEPPLVDFQSKFLSGSLDAMPEVEKAVDKTLLATLMDVLVWPSRVVVPFIPGDYSDLESSCIGILNVRLVEAKELANRYMSGRSNPYVVLFIRRVDHLTKRSMSVDDTSDPIWNEDFQFNIEDTGVQRLTVKVMNRDDEGLDECVGTAEIPIRQLDKNILKDVWIDLVGDPQKLHSAGKVHLFLELKPWNFINDGSGFHTDPATLLIPASSKTLEVHRENAALIKGSSAMEGLKVALEVMDEKMSQINAPNLPESISYSDFSMPKEPNILEVNSQIAIEDANSDDGNIDKAVTRDNSSCMNEVKSALQCHDNMDRLLYGPSLETKVCKEGVGVRDVVPNVIERDPNMVPDMYSGDIACPSKIENDHEAQFQDNVSKVKCVESSILEVANTQSNIGKPLENACGSQSQKECTLKCENAPKTHPVKMEYKCVGAMEEVINAGSSISMSSPKPLTDENGFRFEKYPDSLSEENEGEHRSCTSSREMQNQIRTENQDEPARNVNIDDMFDSEIFEVD